MMTREKSLSLVLLFALCLILVASVGAQDQSAPPNNPVATDSRPALEPKALEIFKASSDRMAAAHTLAFTAVETYETPSRQGHPLILVNKSEVTLQRPDKLRVITPGDGPATEFYYDGKKMTAFLPAEK